MQEINLLLEIYIGQKINYSRGVLWELKGKSRFGDEEKKNIGDLIERKLVKENQPYSIKSIKTLVTTMEGKAKSKALIDNILQKNPALINELHRIPKKVLGFLLITLEHTIFEKSRIDWFLDWRDFMLYKTKLFDYSISFCETLEKYTLAVSTSDYASTKGGRIDPEKYVVPEEVREYLTKNLNLEPFNHEETAQAILFFTLHQIKNGILPIKDDGKRRNKYWNLLRVLPFDESAVETLVGRFQEMNITTPYSRIENEQFLFSVLDKARFDVTLERLVNDFVSQILRGEKEELPAHFKRTPTPLRMHSKLFELIGSFEMKLREYLINEMKSTFKTDRSEWYEQLKEIKMSGEYSPFKTVYDKLESRREEDKKNKILPEDELIYYADIADYKDIVLRNWGHFESKFKRIRLSKEKFEHGMNELNKIRRKVMHLRDIRPYEAKTLHLYIIPELERIFG